MLVAHCLLIILVAVGRPHTHVPEILATRNTSYLTASKSLNDQKIARMALMLTIFDQIDHVDATYFLNFF